ncbi:MAG: hypothetical protein JW779_11290, partial [Candidatus Thorarchaeota archaeon]|nr:hypothetical protein [Candidatus Thorarchaeota archaeon]
MELRLRQPDLELEEEIVEDNAIRPVIKYPGGKSGIADILCELAPREFGVYFEIFGGGLGFGLRLLQKNRV